MGNVTGKDISFNDLCELIDLYKRSSVDGDRVDFTVSAIDDKRIIILKLQDGTSLKESAYLYDNGDDFDNNIYPQLLNYFLADDFLGKWVIEEKNSSFEGYNETQTGNVIYLNTFDRDLFDKVKSKIERKKNKLTNDDIIWDEIIRYAKNRKILSKISLSNEEVNNIYNFILELVNNDNRIKHGNTKDVLRDNENYLLECINNNDTLPKIDQFSLKQLAILMGNEKRIRYRLNLDDEEIKEKIKYAIVELNGVGYFDLKNRITKEMPTIKSKIGVISHLLSQLNHAKMYTEELNEQYRGYSFEVIGYLYRKGMNKELDESNDSVLFHEYSLGLEEKDTKELTKEEIEEIIDSVEQAKSSGINKSERNLFTVVKTNKEKQESNEVLEIKDAYEKSLNYSTDSSPSWIKLLFEEDGGEEADLIISNRTGLQDMVIYRRSISMDKLKNEVMETLRELYTKNNNIHYNFKYKMNNTDNSCLLMIGDKKTTFSIVNAPTDFIDYNKKKLEELMA